jgi:hypothetical protein
MIVLQIEIADLVSSRSKVIRQLPDAEMLHVPALFPVN